MAELTPGTEFAGCRIEATIGRGGMGLIYRAIDLRLDRPVAIKLIAGERAEDPEFRTRFEREARLTAAIDHPNVIPVYGAGEEDGHLYLVMRYVGGTDLAALVAEAGRLPAPRAAAVVAQVAQGLDAAHAAGLVHRDVKPANVLLAGGHVYLSDFGITRVESADTRLTDSGEWIGTVDFMAPEHLRAERTDARADVYGLGCVLYTALTGTPPYRRATVPATVLAHLSDPPPKPSALAAELEPFDEVVARALAKDPADRYPSAGDLGAAALAAAAGEPTTRALRSVATGPAAPADAETRQLAPNGAPAAPSGSPGATGPEGDRPAVSAGAEGGPKADLSGAEGVEGNRRAGNSLWANRSEDGRPGSGDAQGRAPDEDRSAAPAATLLRPDPAVVTQRAPDPGAAAQADRPPPSPPSPIRRHHAGARRRGVAGSLVLAAGLAVAAVVVALVAAGQGSARTGPLSAAEVRGVAYSFARAYAHEDGAALQRTLTADVSRVSPTGVQRGRAAVVGEYRRQFKAYRTVAYTLDRLSVTGGTAGRAAAGYTVRLRGASPITGHLVLAVVRDGSTPRIRLIAAEPRS